VPERSREVLGEVDHACSACGRGCAVAVEVRTGGLRARFGVGGTRRYESCLDCGAIVRTHPAIRPPAAGNGLPGPDWVVL
jgi:hypothetical protein